MNYVGENFRTYEDHPTYFLTQDAVKSLTYDIYFSPMKKYYCHANCSVCYIKNQLTEGLSYYAASAPDKITSADEHMWQDIFEYFYVIRTNDDLRYLKKQYPYVYSWYQSNASIFEFGMTDNSVLLQHDVLINDLNLKGISDISFSEDFLNKKSIKNGKIKAVISDYLEKYGLCKIKVIRTSTDELSEHILELVDWLSSIGIKNCLQQDFRKEDNIEYDLQDTFEYQNSYYTHFNGKSYQIFREAPHMMNDRFFFTIEDATDINLNAFHVIKDKQFIPQEFLCDMLTKKLEWYRNNIDELETATDPMLKKFKSYFTECQNFEVNRDFNFIPSFMFDDKCVFYHKLKTKNFISTDYGLYNPTGKPKPLVEFIK